MREAVEQEGKLINEMRLCFLSRGENESLARLAVAGFIAPLDPTMDVLDDIRTAVSEAVTNAIVHGYEGNTDEIIYVSAFLYEREDLSRLLRVDVEDTGTGIEDVKKAMEPLYTTVPGGERAGMGFAFMEAFTDRLEVKSESQKGTCVSMWKELTEPEACVNGE
ncbi:MAG: anti-sigma F factor [Lachnospiraceae bacterium]|nr:anti-sigma F factor [Lachnospiraceae bacterium]